MSINNKKWIYLIALSLIWGSSYILIKKTLIGLTPLQLGGLRVVFTTLTLFIVGFNSIKKLRSNSLSISLVSFNKFEDNSQIDMKFLIESGFLKKKDQSKSIKVIDSLQFKKKLQFKDFKFTPGARKRIEELGGSAP